MPHEQELTNLLVTLLNSLENNNPVVADTCQGNNIIIVCTFH